MTKLHDDVYDIAVIGLGPVGAAAALLLAQEGLRVLAIEPSPDPYDKPRAFGMDHESLRLMQKLGIADDLSAFLGPYRPSEYRSATGEVLRRIVPQGEPFPLAWPPYSTFIQPELERLLRQKFVDFPSLDIRFGWRLSTLNQDADEARITMTSVTDGSVQQARCRYVVGCDGAWSPVRELSGLTLEDLEFDEPWLVIDMRVLPEAQLPDATVQFCDPARPTTFVHGPFDMRRWEIMLLPGEVPADMIREERIWELLAPWLTPDQGTIWRAATYRFHALVGTQWRRGRVFIAGDAAHQTPPFMAQGLNQGFKDVQNLAWKLAEVILHDGNPALLDSYDEERRPNARAVIELTKTLGRLICERDPVAAARRDATLLAEMQAGRGDIVRQDLLPPIAPGRFVTPDTEAERPLSGTVCPQPWISTPVGERRMDDVLTSRFLLLLFNAWQPDAEQLKQAERLSVTIARFGEGSGKDAQIFVDKRGVLTDWAARNDLVAVLVRPDHVVFGVARSTKEAARLLFQLGNALMN